MKYIIDKNCRPVYLQIYRQIRKDIIDGVYLPGSKLPSMRLLCDELSVSTITVDHAYALLCEEGYIESRERSGFFVIFKKSDGFAAPAETHTVHSIIPQDYHTYPDFPRLMADLEIYVNGTALKQAQGANAIVDTMSATVIKKHNPGMSDTQLRQLITAHIDEDEFCRYVIQRDINGIALALRETHKDDFFSVPEDNPLKEMLETAGEIVSQDSDTEQAYLAFICKRLKLNFRKLSVEERKWLKKIAEKSDLLKNPKPQRGRR